MTFEVGLVSVADAWDAMTHTRQYRQGMGPERAAAILRDGAGSQWRADAVELLLAEVASNGQVDLGVLASLNRSEPTSAEEVADCVCDDAVEQPTPQPTLPPADGAPHDGVLRRVFDASPTAMALVCPQGRLVALNRALCGVVGRSACELVGIPAVNVFHPDEQASASTAMSQVLAEGTIRRAANVRLRTSAGETRIVDVSMCAVEEPPTGMCVLVQMVDVTNRHRRERELENLALIDALTGIANRRGFEFSAEVALATTASSRTQHSSSSSTSTASRRSTTATGTPAVTQPFGPLRRSSSPKPVSATSSAGSAAMSSRSWSQLLHQARRTSSPDESTPRPDRRYSWNRVNRCGSAPGPRPSDPTRPQRSPRCSPAPMPQCTGAGRQGLDALRSDKNGPGRADRRAGRIERHMNPPDRAARRSAALRLAGLLGLLTIVGVATVATGAASVRSTIDEIAESGWRGVVTFVLLYALATLMLVPGSASTATAGLVYGTVPGAAIAVAGATLGASVAYGIARGIGRNPARALMAHRVADLDRWVSERQFRSIMVLRLLPIVPFNVFNYAAGLLPVRPRAYVAGTLVGLVPGGLLVAGLGSSARQPTSPAFGGLLALAIGAAVLSGVLARRRMRR